MHNPEDTLQELTRRTGVRFVPGDPYWLGVIKELGYPEVIVSFYTKYDPEEQLEYGTRLMKLEDLEYLCLHDADVPARLAYSIGLLPFAYTDTGDVLCFDPDRTDPDGWPKIVAVSHETVFEDSTPEEVREGMEDYCDNLPELLEAMISGG